MIILSVMISMIIAVVLSHLSTLLASLNSTWALLNFFVFATRSAKQVSCLSVIFMFRKMTLNRGRKYLDFFSKILSYLPLARCLDEDLASPCLLIDFCFLTFFSILSWLGFLLAFFPLLCLNFLPFPDFCFLSPLFVLFLLFLFFCLLLSLLHFFPSSPFWQFLPASRISLDEKNQYHVRVVAHIIELCPLLSTWNVCGTEILILNTC